MRIAVTYENGEIFQHFGHTERFKVYDVEGGRVSVTAVVNTNGSGHGALADILKKLQVDTLICGGIGAGAQRALQECGIRLYGGADSGKQTISVGTHSLRSLSLACRPPEVCRRSSHVMDISFEVFFLCQFFCFI